MPKPRPARVWDLPTRVFHWALVAGAAGAFVTGDDVRGTDLHAWLGAGVAGLLAFRVGWGFVGEGGARWARFPLVGAARRAWTTDTPGHPPSGALSVVFVLALLGGIAVTGAVVLGGEERRGPLAGLVDAAAGLDAHDAHRVLAWVLPAWLLAHVAGVVLHGRAVRRPVIRAMVTGRAPGADGSVRRRGWAAAGLSGALAAGAALAVLPARTPAAPLPADPTWNNECGACHLAFHPSLLPARAWDGMLAAQADHFGEDLALPADTVAALRAYATANAAETGVSELGARVAREADAAPLRITEAGAWRAVHAALPDDAFADPAVGSRLRCGACHPDADAGTYEGPAVVWPPAPPSTDPLTPGS